jgi:hypothetical protein
MSKAQGNIVKDTFPASWEQPDAMRGILGNVSPVSRELLTTREELEGLRLNLWAAIVHRRFSNNEISSTATARSQPRGSWPKAPKRKHDID